MVNFDENCNVYLVNVVLIENCGSNGGYFWRINVVNLFIVLFLFNGNGWYGLLFDEVIIYDVILIEVFIFKNDYIGIFIYFGKVNFNMECCFLFGNIEDGFYLKK